MCGIAGFIDKKKVLKSEAGKVRLKLMLQTIKHRGRDDRGFFINDNIYLGHNRLSIIDLSQQGHQPMLSTDQQQAITFNGEIYNFGETKKALHKNYSFKTQTDTEVILAAYRQWGLKRSLEKHQGMFAFALYDGSKNKLFLALDRFGIKPLYYINLKNFFFFASEIKALLTTPEVKAKLNSDKLSEFLMFRHLAGKHTLFRDIYRLEPGQFISIDLSKFKLTSTSYWRLTKKNIVPRQRYQTRLVELLKNSTQQHLVADAPLGLQLSGGLDSSLIATLAAQMKKKHFHSFSIGLKDPNWNEFKFSRPVAKKIKSIHHEYVFTEQDFCRLLPKLTYHSDEPLDHTHSVPMYILANKARAFVKILMSGEGADETLGGYKRYQQIFRQAITTKQMQKLSAFVDERILSKVINIKFTGALAARSKLMPNDRRLSKFDKISILDQKTHLISLLMRQDKMGMAANLENRVPYLQHELVEYIYSLPQNQKIKKGEAKIILKKVAEKYLTRQNIYRQKVGFGQPLASWLRNPKGFGLYLEMFKMSRRKFINYRELNKMIKEHKTGLIDHSQLLWILISLELWLKIFIDGQDYRKIWPALAQSR